MKVIGISLDLNILDKDSLVAKRIIQFGQDLDQYYLLIPGKKDLHVQLSNKVVVESLGAKHKFLVLFKIFWRIRSILKKDKIDLLTTQDAYFFPIPMIFLARLYKINFEVQIHGFEKLTWFRKKLATWSLRQADIVRVVSRRLQDLLIKDYQLDAKKIYIVPIATDFAITETKHNIDLHKKYPEDFIFLTIGRLVPVKNIAMQIKALANLKNQKIKIVVVGDGPIKNSLVKLAKDCQVASQVVFAGWQNDLAAYYQTADCLLLTSWSEGYGMVVAESLLNHLPVIMTEVGCAGELLQDNVNGLVVPINDQLALEKAMTLIQSDRSLHLKLKAGTTLTTEQILDVEQVASAIHKEWQSLINLSSKL